MFYLHCHPGGSTVRVLVLLMRSTMSRTEGVPLICLHLRKCRSRDWLMLIMLLLMFMSCSSLGA